MLAFLLISWCLHHTTSMNTGSDEEVINLRDSLRYCIIALVCPEYIFNIITELLMITVVYYLLDGPIIILLVLVMEKLLTLAQYIKMIYTQHTKIDIKIPIMAFYVNTKCYLIVSMTVLQRIQI